jgi:hypothetical protein
MKLKNYSNSVGTVNYGYSRASKKWEFELPNNQTFLTPVPGSGEEKKELANKIANILNGAFVRSGEIDGLARANVNRLVYS